jgi:hypothetical protein
MKSTEKIKSEINSEATLNRNPFLSFSQKIKQFSNQNFIVEWQMGDNKKKEVLNEQAYY